MNIKSIFTNLFIFGFWLYVNYQIYLGITTGEFNDPLGRGSSNWVSYNESPILFVLSMGFASIFSLFILSLGAYFLWRTIDSKVKTYGGNYNLNTLKAIFRGAKS